MQPQMARPQQGGWGAAPPGPHAFNTPGPGFPGGPDLWGMHTPAAGWGMPQPLPQQQQQRAPLGRASVQVGDRIDRFAVGNHCMFFLIFFSDIRASLTQGSDGPVLEPFLVRAVDAQIVINPLLLPPTDDGVRPHLKWNMLFQSNNCQRSTDPNHVSWVKGREEPATFPRVTSLRLVSETVPWMMEINARNRDIGVTCGDVIESISYDFRKYSGQNEYSALPAAKQRALAESYRHNRSRAHGAPGGAIGEGMRRLDWLGKDSMFGGIDRNDRLVRRLCGDVLPCTFELKCIHRYAMTAEEIRDHEARERANNRHRSTVESASDDDDDD